MRTRGRVFPDLPRLLRDMELRSWTNEILAKKSGISTSAAQRVTAGKPVSPVTVEAVAQALLDNPPASTATGTYLLSEAAS